MKKNLVWFWVSLFFFILSTLAIIGLPLGWWHKEPDQPFVAIIILWFVETIFAIALGFNMRGLLKKWMKKKKKIFYSQKY